MPDSLPEVSVILPFYNAAATLQRALDSVQAQSLRNFECLLVNNNSTDGSVAIALAICQNDRRFRLLHESRQGVVYASARAVAHARAPLHCRMDADDQMLPRRLQLQKNFLNTRSEFGVVAGKVRYVPHHRRTEGFRKYVDWVNSVLGAKEIALKRFIESPVVNPSAMWRREVAELYGGYRAGDFPEDYELWLRLLHHGVKIGKVPATVLNWYDSAQRLTRTRPEYSQDAFYRIKAQYLAKWLKLHNPLWPEVAVWGGGRLTRRRAEMLVPHGIRISAWIDIHRRQQTDRPVVFYQELPAPTQIFVLVYLNHGTARAEIQQFLQQRGFVEGRHFLLAA